MEDQWNWIFMLLRYWFKVIILKERISLVKFDVFVNSILFMIGGIMTVVIGKRFSEIDLRLVVDEILIIGFFIKYDHKIMDK